MKNLILYLSIAVVLLLALVLLFFSTKETEQPALAETNEQICLNNQALLASQVIEPFFRLEVTVSNAKLLASATVLKNYLTVFIAGGITGDPIQDAKELRKRINIFLDELQAVINSLEAMLRLDAVYHIYRLRPQNIQDIDRVLDLYKQYQNALRARVGGVGVCVPVIGADDYQPRNTALKGGEYYLIDLNPVCWHRRQRPIPYYPKSGDLVLQMGWNKYTLWIRAGTCSNFTHSAMVVETIEKGKRQMRILSSTVLQNVHFLEFNEFMGLTPGGPIIFPPKETLAVFIRPLITPLPLEKSNLLENWARTAAGYVKEGGDWVLRNQPIPYPNMLGVIISPFLPGGRTLKEAMENSDKIAGLTCAGSVTTAAQKCDLIGPCVDPNKVDAGELAKLQGPWGQLYLLLLMPFEKPK